MKDTSVRADFWDIMLLVAGLGGVGVALSGASATMAMLVLSLGAGQTDDALLMEYLSVAQILLALSSLPALILGGRAVFGRPRSLRRPVDGRLGLLVAAFPLGAILAYLVADRGIAPFLLLPPAQILTAIPPVILAILLVRSAGTVTPRRAWGRFTGGMLFVPLPAVVLEALGAVVVLSGILAGLLMTAEGSAILEQLAAIGASSAPPSTSQLEGLIAQLVRQPVVMVLGMAFMAGFVPVVEEACKTVGVWPWLKRGLSGAEAFAGGAVSGAGYGLFEALFSTPPGEGWVTTAIARSGATLMHAFSAALGSWGLMEGVARRKWARAFLGFGLAVLLHGTWNAAAIWSGIAGLSRLARADDVSALASPAEVIPLVILGMLALLAVFGLAWTTHRLRRTDESAAQQPDEPVPPLAA